MKKHKNQLRTILLTRLKPKAPVAIRTEMRWNPAPKAMNGNNRRMGRLSTRVKMIPELKKTVPVKAKRKATPM